MYHFYSENRPNVDYTRNEFVAELDFIVFSVSAPADVAIALSYVPGVTSVDTVEVYLGAENNQVSYMLERPYGTQLVSNSTPNLLDQNEYR